MKRRLHHFTTDQRDGNARQAGALRRLLHRRKLPRQAATAQQVHGSKVQVVPKLGLARKYPATDGLLTDVFDQPLGIFTADCLPIFLSVSQPPVIGVLHAGWRGVRGNILSEALRILRQRWKVRPSDVSVWTGPAIGACCFEVQWDVARFFPQTRRRFKGRWKVDLATEIGLQIRRLGLRRVRQGGARLCTMHNNRFYSFRRQPTDDRQVSVIVQQREL